MNTNNSTDIIVKGSIFQESAFLLVTKAIDKIMIGGDDITQNDLVISKLLRQDIIKYRSLFPHVSAAIQLSNGDKHPSKGDTIKYIYTNSQHKNPLCRVAPIDFTYRYENRKLDYDKEKYREMILDAAETVLGYFGFDRTIYGIKKSTATRKWRWLEELRQEREKDIKVETMGK
jgi:DNA polymerase elongation subunit (family B)